MSLAYTMQKFQDWFTQQWVILWGRKIIPSANLWLLGPFGELNGIGENFIYQLAQKEKLIVQRNILDAGLLKSIGELNLKKEDLEKLSPKVVDFYEFTANYTLKLQVQWNPLFKILGQIVNRLFSHRINQLNIPINTNKSEELTSEIIKLIDSKTNETKYTIWLRKFYSSGQVIYSGIYQTCKLPDDSTCIKAIFPLPKGSATVIMKPSIGKNNELVLDSSGKKFGDAGFYFLLHDSKNNTWAQYLPSFTDNLTVYEDEKGLKATQLLKLWNFKVTTLNYGIEKNNP